MRFSNYKKAVDYLIHEIPKTPRNVFDDSAVLKKNHQIMQALGNPQETHPAIHVAGTSGKGTICYLVDALLRAHSKRTGMTQSPHVYDIRERIQINGQLMSERQFVQSLNTVLESTRSAGITLTYFETLTAMAYASFGSAKLEYQVIETGFGGRLDASNVITRPDKICIISRIGLDHVEVLGHSADKIATEKAGIIQTGNHAVVLRQEPAVNAVFETRCQEVGATITWIDQTGDYQKTNDLLATTACKIVAERDNWNFDTALADSVLQQAFIPGRFEKRHFKNHLLLLDGAHNPQKLSALTNRLKREGKTPATIILTLGQRKDITNCLEVLKPVAKRIVATEYFTHQQDIPIRPTPADELAEHCKKLGIEAVAKSNPAQALSYATTFAEPIVATGSFYLLSEIDSAF